MSIMRKVEAQVQKAAPGKVMTYADFGIREEQFGALAAALSRLSRQGKITRLAKGRYFKPKTTTFGVLKPQEREIVNSLTRKGEKVVAYESGLSGFRKLGLTSQVPNEVTLVSDKPRRSAQYGSLKVRFVQGPAEFEERDVPLLRLLDAFKNLRRIPDSDADTGLEVLAGKISKLPQGEVKRLASLALPYNPATRALAGALLEKLGFGREAAQLKKTLNRLTHYRLDISERLLPNKRSWNIL